MVIIKRDGRKEQFNENKIRKAISKCYLANDEIPDESQINKIITNIKNIDRELSVEEIQNFIINDLEDLDINWENIKKKEDFYEESLIDILYSMLSYELNKKGYEIFGINMGYESVIYYVVTQDVYKRINKDSELFRIFDLSLLEGIYDEIYEVEEDINSELVEVGDFLEKKVDGYHTLKVDKNYNTLIENVDEDKLKIIL